MYICPSVPETVIRNKIIGNSSKDYQGVLPSPSPTTATTNRLNPTLPPDLLHDNAHVLCPGISFRYLRPGGCVLSDPNSSLTTCASSGSESKLFWQHFGRISPVISVTLDNIATGSQAAVVVTSPLPAGQSSNRLGRRPVVYIGDSDCISNFSSL